MTARLAMRFEGETNSRIGRAYSPSTGRKRLFAARECNAVIEWLEQRTPGTGLRSSPTSPSSASAFASAT